jgi:hypothetical protein
MDWTDVLTAAKARKLLRYQAPMDHRPCLVKVRWIKTRPDEVFVHPPGFECDPFWADEDHVNRFYPAE